MFYDGESIFRRIILMRLILGGGGVDATVSGVSPLSLTNALAKNIVSLTQYGLCTQASTPTPSSPVDIKCNNGALKAHRQSGIPAGYTLLDKLQSTGTQLIETGIRVDTSKDIRITGTVNNISAKSRKVIIGNYTGETNLSFSLEFAGQGQIGLTSNGMRVYFGILTQQGSLPATIYSKSTSALPTDTDISIDFVYTASTHSFVLTCIANNQTYTLSDVVADLVDATSNETLSLFLDKRSAASAIQNPLVIKSMSVSNGTTTQNYLPVSHVENNATVLGMYDTENDTFRTNIGTGDFIAGNPVAEPIDIYADGTPEVISLCGNLYDSNSVVTEKFVRAGNLSETNLLGSESANSAWNCSDYIAVKPNTTYTTIVPSQSPAGGAGLVFFANTTVESAISGVTATEQNAATEYSFTTPSGCKYLRFSWASSGGTDAMLYENSQVQTAHAENLLGIGEYADTQEIISGAVTRNIGIKVFDGSENWETSSWGTTINKGFYTRFFGGMVIPTTSTTTIDCVCTHFQAVNRTTASESTSVNVGYFGGGNSSTAPYFLVRTTMELADFKSYLAAQYAAGTPVIVLYPLAEATTEHVTGQNLSTVSGTNTLTATAEVSPIQLSVVYKAKSE
jgi:hypothetical protein